jgi:hypothetical protein
VPEEEISWWRKFILRIRTGPEDWRLAYLSFGLLLPGFLFPPAFLFLIPASYLVSRAAMSLSNNDIQVKAQKWLVYPSLIVITFLIAGVLLLAPLLVFIPMAVHLEESIMETHNIEIDDHYGILAASLIGMLTCLWCMLEGTICLIFPALPKKLLYPMADWFKRKHAIVLIVLAFVVFSLFLVLWIYSLNTYVY